MTEYKLVPIEPTGDMTLSGVVWYANHGHDNMSQSDCAELFKAMLAALTAQPAESVVDAIKFARFGTGGLVVVDGKYEGENAVFIQQAVVAGKVGASVPAEHKLPDDRLTAGSIVLLFPTKEQAVTVTNALCGDELVKIDELSQPKQSDVNAELLGALKELCPLELVSGDAIQRTNPHSRQMLNSSAVWAVSVGNRSALRVRKAIEFINQFISNAEQKGGV